jgi:RNA polymerase sigma-70 factor, ECF subfamily
VLATGFCGGTRVATTFASEGAPMDPRGTSERPDETLMARYTSGDADAFDELFGRYERRAYAYFLKRTGSRDRAQDLYQELFLRIHRARAAYDPERPFAPWFFRIAHRLWIDDEARAHRSREVSIEGRESRSDGEDGAGRAADRETLARALGALTPEERFVLVAAKLEGRPYGELAAGLGKSADAVKKLASRALQRLRAAALRETEPARVHAS